MTTPKTTRMTTPISRRRLLERTAAGLTFAFTIAADPLELAAGAAAAQTPYAPNLWLTIGTDGIITIVSPAAELGQGSFTTLPLILAEELDADWSKVRMTYPPVWDGKKYGNPEYGEAFATTSSFAVWGYYRNMRLAGAQARRVLLDAVAERWAVPVAELGTEPSVVVHKASGRRIGYGEIAAFAQIPDELRNRPLRDPKNAPVMKDLKEPKDFRLIGHDVPRVDVPLKVTGAAIFGIDVQVPGMVYAAVLQSPYYGGAPVTVDDAAARRIPGVTDVVLLPGGVGVIGATVEATQAGKKLLKVAWSEAKGAQHDSERALEEFAEIARDKSRTGIVYSQVGAAKVAMRGATKVMSGEYRTRYLYHAQMEPLNAIVSFCPDARSRSTPPASPSTSICSAAVSAAARSRRSTSMRRCSRRRWASRSS